MHLSYLAHMAQADGGVDTDEERFFFFMAEKLNIPKSTAEKLLQNPEEVHLTKPEFHDQRQGVLMDVLTMMIVDREIDEREIELCRKFAEFLGFSAETAEHVADGLLQYSLGKINKTEIEEIIDQL